MRIAILIAAFVAVCGCTEDVARSYPDPWVPRLTNQAMSPLTKADGTTTSMVEGGTLDGIVTNFDALPPAAVWTQYEWCSGKCVYLCRNDWAMCVLVDEVGKASVYLPEDTSARYGRFVSEQPGKGYTTGVRLEIRHSRRVGWSYTATINSLNYWFTRL